MMRALWTGASGMIAQQTSLDTISNNMANVNTNGYKKETAHFQSLLYQKLQLEVTNAAGNPKPVIGQVGLGVRNSAIVSQFTQGNLIESSDQYDMAIAGNGFFMLGLPDGSIVYTRNGDFGLSIDGAGIALANSEGFYVLDTTGSAILFDADTDASKVRINEFGEVMYPDENGTEQYTGMTVGLVQFNNPQGLEKTSGSLFLATPNSGEPRIEAEDATIKPSKVYTYRLETSNVQLAEEIVNMIVTQRAYEMNSKSITAADEMLQQANNLRR